MRNTGRCRTWEGRRHREDGGAVYTLVRFPETISAGVSAVLGEMQ